MIAHVAQASKDYVLIEQPPSLSAQQSGSEPPLEPPRLSGRHH
uniref:Uncharacterized protein n=1 Tax=Arundo donax TaxID=35708 RepID=A0A0A9GS74_ARUDO